MKKPNKRLSPQQIAKKLRDAEVMFDGGKSIKEVLKTLEVSEATFHRWRNQHGGMKSEEAKRLKDIEGENSRLKRLLAEVELDKSMLKQAFRGNEQARQRCARPSSDYDKNTWSLRVGHFEALGSREPVSVTFVARSMTRRVSASGYMNWHGSVRDLVIVG